jgi:hypothetical protein
MRQRRICHINKRGNTLKDSNNVTNVNTSNFIKYTLKDLKTHTDCNAVVVGDFNTHLSPINMSSKQKINKEILELNDTID